MIDMVKPSREKLHEKSKKKTKNQCQIAVCEQNPLARKRY